jgi:hypothetical protein
MESMNKSKRRSVDMKSICYRGGSYISRRGSPSRLVEIANDLKNSQSSMYEKSKLLYPEVDFGRLTPEQSEIIKGYISEIKCWIEKCKRRA